MSTHSGEVLDICLLQKNLRFTNFPIKDPPLLKLTNYAHFLNVNILLSITLLDDYLSFTAKKCQYLLGIHVIQMILYKLHGCRKI